MGIICFEKHPLGPIWPRFFTHKSHTPKQQLLQYWGGFDLIQIIPASQPARGEEYQNIGLSPCLVTLTFLQYVLKLIKKIPGCE